MSPEDIARCQEGIELANAGHKETAYKIFGDLYDQGNDEEVTVLFWLAYTTADMDEAQVMANTIERLEPDHPNLPKLQRKMTRWQQSEARKVPPPKPQSRIVVTCPYCGYVGRDRVKSRVSTGGWVTLVVLLLVFFPICWIGLLIRKSYSVCDRCGITLGDIA